MHIEPYSKGCGAVVSNIDLAHVSADEAQELKKLLAEYGVLFFRAQQLSEAAHIDLANALGDIVHNKFFKPVPEFPSIAEVRKEASQEMNIGGGWHTDHSYDVEPALGSILVARELPSKGGNTRFAHLGRACADLSVGLRKTLSQLKAVHSNEHIYGPNGFYSQTDLAEVLSGSSEVGSATHPVIIRHPVSGAEVLYVNPGHVLGIEGWNKAEAFALLEYLYQFVDQPDYTCSFNWEPGSIAIWDNRMTWHFADNDYQGERRLMHRITLAGEPVEAIEL